MQYIQEPIEHHLSRFMSRVFALMALALAVTAATAYYVSTIPQIYEPIFKQPAYLFALLIAQLGMVVVISFFINRLPTWLVYLLFFIYAVSLGVTFSIIFLVYTQASIYATFFVAASMFGAMALYGYFTKADLTAIGNILFMALIGLIVGLLINYWLKSPLFDYVLSALGVLVFTMLTAYDVQRIKRIAQYLMERDQTMNKVAVIGALTLYLDFVNLFIYLLRFMGKRRD